LGGVNHLTVRQAIGALTKEGLLFSVKGKGTFVADQTELNRRTIRGAVGVVCSALADGFAHQMIVGVESYLRPAGYELILCNSDYSVSNEAEHLRRLHARGVDGVLLVPYMPPANKELIETLCSDEDHPMHVVCLDHGYPNSDLPLVDVDNRHASYEAISYLIALGHRRIGFLVNSLSWIETIETIKQRFLGYRQALQDHKIRFDKDLVQEVGPTLASMRPQDVGLEHYGYQAMHKLLMLREPPTAVFLLWDELAPGAMAAIRNSGLEVPRDISLLGFNDDLLARILSVPLTTIRQPAEQIGRDAANMIVDLIKNRAITKLHHTLSTKLIIRGSTVRPPSCKGSVEQPDDIVADSEASRTFV